MYKVKLAQRDLDRALLAVFDAMPVMAGYEIERYFWHKVCGMLWPNQAHGAAHSIALQSRCAPHYGNLADHVTADRYIMIAGAVAYNRACELHRANINNPRK